MNRQKIGLILCHEADLKLPNLGGGANNVTWTYDLNSQVNKFGNRKFDYIVDYNCHSYSASEFHENPYSWLEANGTYIALDEVNNILNFLGLSRSDPSIHTTLSQYLNQFSLSRGFKKWRIQGTDLHLSEKAPPQPTAPPAPPTPPTPPTPSIDYPNLPVDVQRDIMLMADLQSVGRVHRAGQSELSFSGDENFWKRRFYQIAKDLTPIPPDPTHTFLLGDTWRDRVKTLWIISHPKVAYSTFKSGLVNILAEDMYAAEQCYYSKVEARPAPLSPKTLKKSVIRIEDYEPAVGLVGHALIRLGPGHAHTLYYDRELRPILLTVVGQTPNDVYRILAIIYNYDRMFPDFAEHYLTGVVYELIRTLIFKHIPPQLAPLDANYFKNMLDPLEFPIRKSKLLVC